MPPVDGSATLELPYALPYLLPCDSHPHRRVLLELSAVSNASPLAVGDGSFGTSSFNHREPVLPSPSPGLHSPGSPPSSTSTARAAGVSCLPRRGSGGVIQFRTPDDVAPGIKPRLVRHLGRWLCGWTCSGGSGADGDGGDGDGGCIRRVGRRGRRLSRSRLSQPAARSLSNSAGERSHRSSPAAAAGRVRSSVTGRLESANNSRGTDHGSGDSQLGPLPSLRPQDPLDSLLDSPRTVAMNKDSAAAAATAMRRTLPQLHWLTNTPPAAATSVSSPQIACYNGTSSGGYVSTEQLLGTAAAPAAGSCTSSIASYTSGVTTTSRPSRWGLLAGVLSAGLRSLSQLTSIMEPDTGNLSREVVYDLTRRASQLNAVRAAGQISDMSFVGSGSVGLVYRGRISDGGGGGRTVCVKHLVARGADEMAAPAMEGLLSRALAHPNIIRTLSWYVTRITPESFLELPEALVAIAFREQHGRGRILAKYGRHRCYTKASKRRRSGGDGSGSGGVGVCHSPPPAGTPSVGRSTKAPAAPSALPPPPPLPPVRQRVLQQLRSGLLPERGPSQSMDFDFSRSAAWMEDFYLSSDVTSYSILQQAAATCDAAAAAAVTVAAGTVGPSFRRSGNTSAWQLSRDSVSSHLFTLSPNSSNQTPEIGILLCNANRGTQYAAGGTAATAASTAGDDNLIFGSTVVPTPSGLISSQVVSGGGHRGGGGGIPVSRGRGMLTHTASRLHFSTTPITQLSIPEHTQAVGLTEEASLCASTGGGTQASGAVPSGRSDSRRLLLPNSSSSSEAMDYGNLSSIGGQGRPLCVGALLPPRPAVIVTAAAAAVAESSICSSCMTRGGGAFTDGCSNGTGYGPRKNVDAGSILSALCMQSQRSLKEHSSLQSEQGQRGRKDTTNSGRARTGLLAAALAASSLHSPDHSPGMQRCQTPCSAISSGTSTLVRPAGARAPPPPPPPLLDLAGGTATGDARQQPRPNSGGDGQSRISSAVLTRCATTNSSAKHPTGTIKNPNSTQMLTAGVGAGGLGTSAGIRSAYNLTTPSGNGSGRNVVASGSTPDGGMYTGSSSSSGGSCAVMEAAAAAVPLPPPRLLAAAAGKGDAMQQEALEQGWQTLQLIMRRLNAKPGDYLTRIVMEDADQGSLLEALRHGRFGVNNGRLRVVLLTALDIARGMAFLHGHNVIHGDLKPSNVLLCSDPRDPRGFIAKVSDFGLSRVLINRDHDFLHNREAFPAGTVRYLAPEAVSGASYKASDVWSFAVMLWQLVTGVPAPWPGLRSVQIIMGVMQDELRLQVPPWVYPPLGHLIESCLSYSHNVRPTFNDIIERLQTMLLDISEHQELAPCDHAASASVDDSPFSVAATVPKPVLTPLAGPATAHLSLPPTSVLPWSRNAALHASSPWDRPEAIADCPSGSTDTAFPSGVTDTCESHLAVKALNLATAPAAFHSATTTAAGLQAFGPAIARTLPQGSIVLAVAAPADGTAAAAVTTEAVSNISGTQPFRTCNDNSGVTGTDGAAIHDLTTPDSRSEFRTGFVSTSGSSSRLGSGESSAIAEDREGRRFPGTPTHGSAGSGSHAAITGVASGGTIASGAVAGSLNTAQCSHVAISTAFTAAASSYALTQMSSSWAQTATTTTLGGAVLDCDPGAAAFASAWHSSALQLPTSIHANISNSLVRIGFAGSVGSSGLHPLSRAAGMVVGCSIAGTGSNGGAMALALERQSSQEAYGRLRTSTGAVLTDDQCSNSSIKTRGGGGASHLPAHMPMFAASAAAGGALRVLGGLVHHAGGFTFGGGGGGVIGEVNHFFLPPVHEEPLPTSSSGLQTVMTPGSGLSSGVTQVSVGDGANTGATATGEHRSPAMSSDLASAAYCGAEASLPRMLQAGLIVLGTRELVNGRSASVHYPGGMHGPGPIAMSGEREEQVQVQQRQRCALASSESLLLGAPSYSSVSGCSD